MRTITGLVRTRLDVIAGNRAITEIDKVLHAERAIPGGGKVSFSAPLNTLPPGTLFENEDRAFLVGRGTVQRWSYEGYSLDPMELDTRPVKVLTPASVVRTFHSGFAPSVHISAIQ